jgi:4-aminobutyrate aminotransferase/diaminobutyrate-pyruvate transaminase/4-aminobutyrate aminotransferase/(S)-3-amino-2-methylpropionate transaminase
VAKTYPLTPKPVPPVETELRRITTPIPVPESIPVLERLARFEPLAMQGQPPVLWDHAVGFQVSDAYGNRWIDWSSGVLITNAGHGHPKVVKAIQEAAGKELLTTYAFPSALRAELVERLSGLLPEKLKKIFLLTTGSEAVECAIKLCRTHGVRVGGQRKNIIVSFEKAFHGRTLGSQQAGGIPALKDWIVNFDPGFVQAPFPDGYRTEDTSFDFFLRCLEERGIAPEDICGVVFELYQGGSVAFAPDAYIQRLRAWCDQHQILMVADEVQAGFGRTGTLWGYEQYQGIVPDLVTWGKGISSSLPIAAVAGSAELMDMHPPGSMSSTHTGNPVCCAAALASLEVILEEGLVDNCRQVGGLLQQRLREIASRYPEMGDVQGRGLVAGIACVKPGTKEPDGDLAWETVRACVERGLLMFCPVGFGGATIKICPPLCITAEAIEESCAVLEEAFQAVLHSRAVAAPTEALV